MRYLFGFLCVCALSAMPLIGCSEPTAEAGSGGSAGEGGSGGDGGGGGTGGVIGCDEDACDDANLCTIDSCFVSDFGGGGCVNLPVDCDDFNDCTTEMCDPADGSCSRATVADGTPCAGGMCQSGACELTDSLLPCTEQGIRNAIAAGGGPYTFECDRPENIVLTNATIVIANNVILDGEGKLTLDGVDHHGVFSVPEGVTAGLSGFIVTGGSSENEAGGIDISEGATMTLTNSTVSGNRANQGGGIANDGTLTMTNCTVRDNVAEDGRSDGIFSAGTLIMTNCTVSGNGDTGIPQDGQQPLPRGAILNEGTMTLLSCTVSGDIELSAPGSATLMNTLIDGECEGDAPTSNGYNIESPGNTCGFDPDGTDQVSVSADVLNLGELAENGGPTMTHEPGDGGFGSDSAAIDQIPVADCGVTTDQRGEPRPAGPDPKRCDVGSVEVQPEP